MTISLAGLSLLSCTGVHGERSLTLRAAAGVEIVLAHRTVSDSRDLS